MICLFQILHAGKGNKNAAKSLIAAEYTGVKVELVENFEMGVSNKTPEFLKMNPIGKVGQTLKSSVSLTSCVVFLSVF